MIAFAYTVQWDVIRPAIGELWHGLRITLELSILSLIFSLADSNTNMTSPPGS